MTDAELKQVESWLRESPHLQVGASVALALIDRVRNAEARAKALERFVDGFAQTVDGAVRHAENDGTGMQVPYHGDFTMAKQSPSLLRELKWWRSAAREALDTTS